MGDIDVLNRLHRKTPKIKRDYKHLDMYYEGLQKIDVIGLAVPPELMMFEVAINVPRMAVDEPERRQQLRAFQRSGSDKIDRGLQEAWEYNNLPSQSSLLHKDCRTFGRGFAVVSTNPEEPDQPLITVESPEAFSVEIDPRRRMTAALRTYTGDDDRQRATLYLPNKSRYLIRDGHDWADEFDPDEHGLGRVPVVMFLNRPRTGRWTGVSEMADVIPMTDAIARIITNTQIGAEALAWPHRWAAGVKKEDFINPKTGKPMATWEAYMTILKVTSNKDARFGSWDAAQLSNFTDAVNAMLRWCGGMLGLPTRYLGQDTVNPASEGAIRADEARLIRNVERMNVYDGDSWAWVMGLRERLRTGEWLPGNEIRALWHDPATPTYSQRADALTKMAGGVPILSREGVWDELGWDEGRKQRERAYFREQDADPLVQALMAAPGDVTTVA